MTFQLHSLFLVICLAAALGAAGCTSSTDEVPVAIVTETFATPAARKHFPQASNHFALDLFGRLRQEKGNLVVSPVSVATALGMVLAGARGTTAEEIAAALHVADLSR
jgi:serpin B